MSYLNANIVLPKELIKEIQKYADGINLYIPKVPNSRNGRKELEKSHVGDFSRFFRLKYGNDNQKCPCYHRSMTDRKLHDKCNCTMPEQEGAGKAYPFHAPKGKGSGAIFAEYKAGM